MKCMQSTLKSAITVALFLLFPAEDISASMPLTETIYTPPPGKVEVFFSEECVQVNDFYLKERLKLGVGILTNFSAWIEFPFLHGGLAESSTVKNEIGDISFKLWTFIGDFYKDTIHLGFMFRFRFPSGRNAYEVSDWRSLSLGKNEITLGTVWQFDFIKSIFLHFNFFYTFREGLNENFYGGFFINPIEGKTWSKLFGLNPVPDDTFFSFKRMRNDYITLSCALNSGKVYPFLPYIELYGSFRVFRGDMETDNLPIEGAGIDTFLISVGLRYFFNRKIFLGIYTVQNPVQSLQPGYLKSIYGLDFSAIF